MNNSSSSNNNNSYQNMSMMSKLGDVPKLQCEIARKVFVT